MYKAFDTVNDQDQQNMWSTIIWGQWNIAIKWIMFWFFWHRFSSRATKLPCDRRFVSLYWHRPGPSSCGPHTSGHSQSGSICYHGWCTPSFLSTEKETLRSFQLIDKVNRGTRKIQRTIARWISCFLRRRMPSGIWLFYQFSKNTIGNRCGQTFMNFRNLAMNVKGHLTIIHPNLHCIHFQCHIYSRDLF